MKVLVVGGGGREHALVWKLRQSDRVTSVTCAPGNAGTAQDGQNVAIGSDDIDGLLKLPGVGRKTANLVVTLGYRKPGICVDTHVHRITNRWGYLQTKTPEQTETALREKLPRRYWIMINDLLVTYGQNLCKPISPFCSRCKIHRYCDRVGVEVFR